MTSSNWAPNAAQRKAVEHATGPLRIQAGAGSGKTTTLVHRIRSLVERGLCRPDQILLLTFTTKAVEQMRQKLDQLLGTGAERPRVDTYHAFALSLVQEFAQRLGLPATPAILTAAGPGLLVRQAIDRFTLDCHDLTQLDRAAQAVTGFVEWHRHEGTFRQDPASLLARLGPADDPAYWAEMLGAYESYRTLLRERGALDYGDQIALAVELLQHHDDVRAEVQGRFPFLLVDEYQDTDFLQGELVRLLAGEAGNVTIVGDPDQTIYSFRGAAMTNIRHFHEAYPAVVDVTMATNYRSTPAIIETANAAILGNTRRKAELLEAGRTEVPLRGAPSSPGGEPVAAHGGPSSAAPGGQPSDGPATRFTLPASAAPRPLLVEAPDWPAEDRWLVHQIQTLKAEGYRYAEMAILLRKNHHKEGLAATLVEAGIPVQVVGGLDLLNDPEAIRCIGLLQALANPADDQAITMALSAPRYGLTDHDLALLAQSRRRDESLVQAVGRSSDARLQAFQAEFWPLYQRQFTAGCQATVRAAIEHHREGLGPETRTGLEQLLDLADTIDAHPGLFTASEATSDLALFVQYLADLRGVGESFAGVSFDDAQEAVKLMTAHVAKGLEFPVLFLPRLTANDFGLKDGKWDRPFPLAWHHDQEFAANAAALLDEEERRLFYVAVTRAMERLYLSWAPIDPARKRPVKRSPFLAEVEATCEVVKLSGEDAAGQADGASTGPTQGPASASSTQGPAPTASASSTQGPAPTASDGSTQGPATTASRILTDAELASALAPLISTAPPTPRPEVAAPLHPDPALPAVLSFSHLQTYQTCPFRFYLQHVLRLPGRPSHAADEGVRLHAAIAKLAAAGGALTFEQFGALAQTGQPEPDRVEHEVERDEAPASDGTVDPLQAFWSSEYAQTKPIASEQEFYLRLGPAVLRGFIDWLHPLPDGGVEVVDFKAYTRLRSAAEVKAGLQLPLYLLACREALGYAEASVGSLFFLKHGQVVRVEYSDEELGAARRQAEGLVEAIQRREWGATPGATACGFCPYRDECPAAQL